jgi:hypothetical protein
MKWHARADRLINGVPLHMARAGTAVYSRRIWAGAARAGDGWPHNSRVTPFGSGAEPATKILVRNR